MATVLVTGGSSGIGWELAKVFASKGDSLVLVARREDELQAKAGSLGGAATQQHQAFAYDLSEPDAVGALAGRLEHQGTTVDVLVNNAGFGDYGLFAETELETDLAMIQVNIVALTELTKRLLPGMLARRDGKILNLASTAAFLPGPRMAVYYASKAYVLSFSEALAEEVRDSGVSVTALCPGPTKTGFEDRAGAGPSRLFKYGTADAAEVASAGYDGLMARKTVVVPGLSNRVTTFLPRVAPRRLTAKVVKRAQAPSR
ncbi:MAG: SDR family NAD(P)-dependent oxidoreductase [Thermomicrobiales bacterium]